MCSPRGVSLITSAKIKYDEYMHSLSDRSWCTEWEKKQLCIETATLRQGLGYLSDNTDLTHNQHDSIRVRWWFQRLTLVTNGRRDESNSMLEPLGRFQEKNYELWILLLTCFLMMYSKMVGSYEDTPMTFTLFLNRRIVLHFRYPANVTWKSTSSASEWRYLSMRHQL